jgi:hypothetical protein
MPFQSYDFPIPIISLSYESKQPLGLKDYYQGSHLHFFSVHGLSVTSLGVLSSEKTIDHTNLYQCLDFLRKCYFF